MWICLTRSLFYVYVCLVVVPYPSRANYIDNRLTEKKFENFGVIKQSCIVELRTSFHSTSSWFSLNRSCNIIVMSLLSQYTEHYYLTRWHVSLRVCIETSFVQSIYIPKPKPETGFSFAKSITPLGYLYYYFFLIISASSSCTEVKLNCPVHLEP